MKHLIKYVFLLFVCASSNAYADEYGSLCINKNGLQHCVFWTWSSDTRTLFERRVVRNGDNKRKSK